MGFNTASINKTDSKPVKKMITGYGGEGPNFIIPLAINFNKKAPRSTQGLRNSSAYSLIMISFQTYCQSMAFFLICKI